MPYIKAEDRDRLTPPEGMVGDIPRTQGELNYLISTRIKREFTEKGKSYALFNDIIADLDDAKLGLKMLMRMEPGFAGDISDLAFKFMLQTDDLDVPIGLSQEETAKISKRQTSAGGAIEAAKLEFYRRVVAPYEDQKLLDNGDVY